VAAVVARMDYTATIRRSTLPTADGPFAVNVATRMRGQHGHCDQTLTLDRGTAVAITGVEGATTRSTRLRRADVHRDHGYGGAGLHRLVNDVAATVLANGPIPRPSGSGGGGGRPLAVTVTSTDARQHGHGYGT
jgi:hypothetical protein